LLLNIYNFNTRKGFGGFGGDCSNSLIFAQTLVMELSELFEKAVSDSKSLSEKPSNETLLQLYSLYKQATEGDNTSDPPSNPFDFVAKAKYEAWSGQSGKTKEQAMQDYVSLVNKLKG
jgi:diazepam-binding inhibitor (GABA receptor modulating acyl-CoA-binding protein)